jgi:nucleoid DNA-binding protein
MEIKDKPQSMSVREWITKKVATGIMIPENIVRRVISHNYDSAYEAMKSNNSIEISGFGKFYFNAKKADKEIEHCIKQKNTLQKGLESSSLSEVERRKIEKDVKYMDKKINWLHGKIK